MILDFFSSFDHFLWATWANPSWSLICLERPKRFAHSRSFPLRDLSNSRCSFFLSHLSESLTVVHLIWAKWANEQMSEWAMSKFPALLSCGEIYYNILTISPLSCGVISYNILTIPLSLLWCDILKYSNNSPDSCRLISYNILTIPLSLLQCNIQDWEFAQRFSEQISRFYEKMSD